MDPVSRRFMWNLISTIAKDRAIVLTSHFMDECDALCTRIGILNRGELKCLGSSQHLKSRFGKGYNIEIKLKEKSTENLMNNFMNEHLVGAVLMEVHDLVYRFEVPQKNLSLSKIFGEIEMRKDEIGIEDYSVSQTSLEQIFLQLSKPGQQRDYSEEKDV